MQLLGFLHKYALILLLTDVEYGQAVVVAGLLTAGAQRLAILGLDEAIVYARHVGPRLFGDLRRVHSVSGFCGMLCMLALAGALRDWETFPRLGLLLASLAPLVFIANLAVLPRALLLRAHSHRQLFHLSLYQNLALVLVSVGAALAGLGDIAFVLGMYANAITALVFLARATAALRRELDQAQEGQSVRELLRYGVPLTGPSFLGFCNDNLDGLAVGGRLGPEAAGTYGFTLQLSQAVVNWTVDLSERLLFPVLAARPHGPDLTRAYRKALRVVLIYISPLHIWAAVAAAPLVQLLFPPRLHSMIPILFWLSLAAGLRCLEVVALSGLKARGKSRLVLIWSILQVSLTAIVLAFVFTRADLPIEDRLTQVALAMAGARALTCAGALLLGALFMRGTGAERDLRAPLALILFAALFVPLTRLVERASSGHSALLVLELLELLIIALVVWLGVRRILDAAALRTDGARIARVLGGKN